MKRRTERVKRERLNVILKIRRRLIVVGKGEAARLAGRGRQRPLPKQRVFQTHQRPAIPFARNLVERDGVAQAVGDAPLRMIVQVLPDAGQGVLKVDAALLQHGRRTHARALQQMRRADGAGGKNDFPAGDGGFDFVAGLIFNGGRAAAVKHNSAGLGARPNREVGAAEYRLDKSVRHGLTHALCLVDLIVAGAKIVAPVEIIDPRNAASRHRLKEILQRLPIADYFLHRHLPVPAVIFVGERIVAFVPDKIGQDIRPAPAVATVRRPTIVIRRLTANINHAVDGGRASQNLSARIVNAAVASVLVLFQDITPIGFRIAHRVKIADGNFQPDISPAGAARFKQQNAGAVAAQTVGEQATGGTAAHNNVIVFPSCHFRPILAQ